ncbi:MAG TPA: hypothetical protein VJ689_09145 [Gaiellaceae bacterium]|nr:hypothetical protein [Gaiellaceae bacterium]
MTVDDSGHDAFPDDPSVAPAGVARWLDEPVVGAALGSIEARPGWQTRAQGLREGRAELDAILRSTSLSDLLAGVDALRDGELRMLLALRLVLDRTRELAPDPDARQRFWEGDGG